MSDQYTSVECEDAHGTLKAILAGERDDEVAITLTRGTLGAIARVIDEEIAFRAGFVRRASAAEAQLAAERARAETYKQQAVVNGQRRDMEREMRETAEQQLATERARAEAAEGRASTYEKQHRSYVRQLDAERERCEAAEGREARLRDAVQAYVDRYGRTSDDGWRPSFQGLRAALAGTPEGEL